MTPEEFAEKNCRCLQDYKDRNLFDPMCPCRDIEDAFREGMGEGSVEIDRLRSRLARLEEVVKAAREWGKAKVWADENARLMRSSKLSTEEAAKVMDNYFKKNGELSAALSALDEGEVKPCKVVNAGDSGFCKTHQCYADGTGCEFVHVVRRKCDVCGGVPSGIEVDGKPFNPCPKCAAKDKEAGNG